MRLEVSGRTAAVLWSNASRMCSKDSILESFLDPSLFTYRFVSTQAVHPYNSTDTATTWKNSYFILPECSDFHKGVNLSLEMHTLSVCALTSFSVDEILLPRYMNWSTNLCYIARYGYV